MKRRPQSESVMLRLGLIGLGEVAQLIHLPILQRLGTLYSLAGAYDPSPSVAAAVCPRWGIARTFATAEDLIASPDIDAVLVLSPDQYHGAHARAALQAGKHVLIEKPCCLERTTSRRCPPSPRRRPGRHGRLHAPLRPAFVEAKARLPELNAITYVRVRDVICEGPWFFQQVDQVAVPAGDIPTALIDESRSLRAGMVDKVIGADAPADLRTAYSVLTGLSSHSLSAMRDLIGSPKRVIAAEVKQGGAQITALFDYGAFTALYECMIGDVVRFEAGFEINTRTERLAWEYPTPYVRNLPMVLDVQHSTRARQPPDPARAVLPGPVRRGAARLPRRRHRGRREPHPAGGVGRGPRSLRGDHRRRPAQRGLIAMQPLVVLGNVNVDLILGPVAPWPQVGIEIFVPHDELRVGGSAGNTALAWAGLGVAVPALREPRQRQLRRLPRRGLPGRQRVVDAHGRQDDAHDRRHASGRRAHLPHHARPPAALWARRGARGAA